jgi:subtilase family serine protease
MMQAHPGAGQLREKEQLMRNNHRRLSLALAAVLAAALASATAASASNNSDYVYVPDSAAGPMLSVSGPHLPGVGNNCGPLVGAPIPVGCYDPAQIRQAYNVPSTYDGAGQTIIIVEAYGDPTIEADLALFDQFFGLPAPPSFTVYRGSATQTAGPHGVAGWVSETALDVEWAHAIAPKANLVLIEAAGASGSAVNAAVQQIVPKYPGAIVSMSFGIEESAISGNGNNTHVRQMHKNLELFAALGDTIVASDGDFGASNGTPVNSPQYPASDPLTLSVGGTMGLPAPLGLCPPTSILLDQCSYGGEQVWNEPSTVSTPVAAGGAPSLIWPTPSYQAGLGLGTRAVPDVAYNAAINGGVLVAVGGHIGIFGGTSAGAPQWAGIMALVNQARAQNGKPALTALSANAALYGHPGDFHDITVGNNTLAGSPVAGYNAGPGYDLATGLGTPNVANLINDLK